MVWVRHCASTLPRVLATQRPVADRPFCLRKQLPRSSTPGNWSNFVHRLRGSPLSLPLFLSFARKRVRIRYEFLFDRIIVNIFLLVYNSRGDNTLIKKCEESRQDFNTNKNIYPCNIPRYPCNGIEN